MLHNFNRSANKKKLTFLQSAANTAGQTSYTFSSQNLGVATNDRVIIVCAFGSAASSFTLNSITLGGTAMTSVVSTGSTVAPTSIYRITSTSGTSANVVVTFSGSSTRCAIAMYSLTGFGTVTNHDTASTLASTATLSNTIDTAYNGVIIGIGNQFRTGGSTISSYAGFTSKDVDSVPDTDSRLFVGSSNFTTAATNATYSVTFSNTSTGNSSLVSAAFS